jgi:hypothetical protein
MAAVKPGEVTLRESGTVVETSETYSDDYVGPINKDNQLEIYVYFTLGSLTSLKLWVKSAPNAAKAAAGAWCKESVVILGETTGEIPVKGGYYTMEASDNLHIPVPHMAKYVVVSWQGVGTNTSSDLEIILTSGDV